MVKIYALIDPRNGKPFYIGATKQNLEIRLKAHIAESYGTMPIKRKFPKVIKMHNAGELKRITIAQILNLGKNVKVKLLKEVSIKDASFWERYYYIFYKERGVRLFQVESLLNYTQKLKPQQ